METKIIYVVYDEMLGSANDIVAAFETKEELEKFMHRFKDPELYKVHEVQLNPQFRGDKTRNAYTAFLEKSGEVNVRRCDCLQNAEMAIDDRYQTFDHLYENPMSMEYYLLAETAKEALAKATVRFKQLVAEGIFVTEGKVRKERF